MAAPLRERGRKAIFLDRDGTLNRDVHFLAEPDQLEILEGVPEALAALRRAGFLLIGITNQSGIARGYLDEAGLARIHERMQVMLGTPLDAIFHCPHHPDTDEGDGAYRRVCDCRKPADGLTRRACDLFGIDPGLSFTVGDSARDVFAGRRAGTKTVLVRSGKPWQEQLARCEEAGVAPDHVADDLSAATAFLLQSGPSAPA